MPRKKKEVEKEQEFEEIKDKQEIEEGEESEEGLEGNVENTIEEIDDNKFIEFFSSGGEAVAPVLSKIEIPGFEENLEENVADAPSTATRRTGEGPNYITTYNEPDYVERKIMEERRGATMEPPVLRPNIDLNMLNQNPELQFLDNDRERGMEPRHLRGERFEEDRHLPFEKKDKKYNKVRL